MGCRAADRLGRLVTASTHRFLRTDSLGPFKKMQEDDRFFLEASILGGSSVRACEGNFPAHMSAYVLLWYAPASVGRTNSVLSACGAQGRDCFPTRICYSQ